MLTKAASFEEASSTRSLSGRPNEGLGEFFGRQLTPATKGSAKADGQRKNTLAENRSKNLESAASVEEQPVLDYLDIADLCRILKRSKSSVYQLTSRKEIPHFKVAGKVMFSSREIAAWVEGQRVCSNN